MKSNRITNEELNKRWDYVGDDNISWYYGDKPKYIMNNDSFHKTESKFNELKSQLDTLINIPSSTFKPLNDYGVYNILDAYDRRDFSPCSDYKDSKEYLATHCFESIINREPYKSNKNIQDIIKKMDTCRSILNLKGVDAFIVDMFGDNNVEKYNASHGSVLKLINDDKRIIFGEMTIAYKGKYGGYNLTIFNNYLGRTSLILWCGKSGGGMKAYIINDERNNCDKMDKEDAISVLNSIDKDNTYGIIYKELRDLALKMIKEDK